MSAAGIACSGAPRDLGLDQGRALREEIRAAAAGLPWRARVEAALGGSLADPLCARVDRDLRRHYPHMAERLDGLARGAGVRPGELSALLACELAHPAAPGPAASRGVLVGIPPAHGTPALVARSLPDSAPLRESAPDHDYASREHASPWLVPALAGRNECGLCVVGASQPPGDLPGDACAAPALLLVQDCLQRFDTTQKAVEWCEGRPAGGRATLLIADVVGDLARIEIGPGERTVERPEGGPLVAARSRAEEDALRKAVREARDPVAGVRSALGTNGEAVALFEAIAASQSARG